MFYIKTIIANSVYRFEMYCNDNISYTFAELF